MAKKKRFERHIDWSIEPWASFAFHHSKGREDFRILRRALGFTQTRCAEFLGVHRKTLGQWEQLKRPMPRWPYTLLLLFSESRHFTVSHSAWGGWHVARDGRLYTSSLRMCRRRSRGRPGWESTRQCICITMFV